MATFEGDLDAVVCRLGTELGIKKQGIVRQHPSERWDGIEPSAGVAEAPNGEADTRGILDAGRRVCSRVVPLRLIWIIGALEETDAGVKFGDFNQKAQISNAGQELAVFIEIMRLKDVVALNTDTVDRDVALLQVVKQAEEHLDPLTGVVAELLVEKQLNRRVNFVRHPENCGDIVFSECIEKYVLVKIRSVHRHRLVDSIPDFNSSFEVRHHRRDMIAQYLLQFGHGIARLCDSVIELLWICPARELTPHQCVSSHPYAFRDCVVDDRVGLGKVIFPDLPIHKHSAPFGGVFRRDGVELPWDQFGVGRISRSVDGGTDVEAVLRGGLSQGCG